MMSRSNLAFEQKEFFTADEIRYSNLRIKTSQTAPSMPLEEKTVKAKASKKQKRSSAFAMGILVVMAFLVLCRGAMITEKYDKLEEKKAYLEQLQTTNQKLQIEIDSALSLKNVEDAAVTKLNMARPEKNQTVYIKIQQDGVVEKTDNSSPTKAVTNFLGMLKAYLD